MIHQGIVDCGRSALLLPIGNSILNCEKLPKCSLLETTFLLLVTVSTINLLTIVLNDAPVTPEDSDLRTIGLLMDSPQCVLFGAFMIWFASITINLGPTFLSGAIAAGNHDPTGIITVSCPIIFGPFRHHVLNILWIFINLFCIVLTGFHLKKLYNDITRSSTQAVRVASMVTTMLSINPSSDRSVSHQHVDDHIDSVAKDAIQRVKMFSVITVGYLVFWAPLFFVTLVLPAPGGPTIIHEISLYIAYVHAFINPILFLIMHRALRQSVAEILCCSSAYLEEDLHDIQFSPQMEFNSASGSRNYM